MALTNKTFSELITFTRSGTATRVNSAGLIEDVAANTPRFDHDPVTGAAKGLLIEESRTNLLTDSEDFTQSAWTATGASINPNQVLAPDGTASADKLVEDATTNLHSVDQLFTSAATTQYTISAYVKAAGRNYAALRLGGAAFGGGTIRVAYDLTDGSTNVDSGTPDDYGAEDAGNGWYRIYLVATTTTGGATSPVIYAKDALAGAISYSGDGSSGVYLWGAQLEAGSFPTSLIKTPASFTSRASTATYFDSAGVMQTAAVDEARTGYKLINGTWTSMGLLLEAAATNLLSRSEDLTTTWVNTNTTETADAAVAPDGTTTADELIEDSTASASHYIAQNATVTANAELTASVFLKAGSGSRFAYLRGNNDGANRYAVFNLATGAVTETGASANSASIEDVGGGWYRCILQWTTGADTSSGLIIGLADSATPGDLPTYNGDGSSSIYVWGAQLEANAYATSYIPTTTTSVTRSADVSSSSTVTRNADNASITGTAFSDWFNASEGTVFVEASGNDTNNANSVAWCISDGDNNDRIQSVLGTTSHLFVADAGVTQVNLDAGGFSNGVAGKMAAAFKVNDFAACIDGGAVATDTGGTIPTVDRMTIGANAAGNGAYLNGHIKNIKFYPSRLTDAELQALTT